MIGNCLTTSIGSLPFRDVKEAIDLVSLSTPHIPAWPQLPQIPEERMIVQFTEGMPGLKREEGKVFFDTSSPDFEAALLTFYEDYLAAIDDDSPLHLEKFRITPQYSRGIPALVERLPAMPSVQAIKGQVTGPFTLATGITDQEKKIAYYSRELHDIVVKTICLKLKWQVRQFKQFGLPLIFFIDEPGLAGFGSSAFISISVENVRNDLNEVIKLIHSEHALAGIHCCENTDWSIILTTDVDVINFDAYGFFHRLVLYENELKAFIKREGVLAWGIVPTSSAHDVEKENVDSLADRWRNEVEQLQSKGIQLNHIVRQSLITPSCGVGSLAPDIARKVFLLLSGLSERLRKDYASETCG